MIRTHDPLRPRQVRYQAALRPDICCSIDSKTPANPSLAGDLVSGRERASTVSQLCQNPVDELHQASLPILLISLISYAGLTGLQRS